jgi:hypothetical protein
MERQTGALLPVSRTRSSFDHSTVTDFAKFRGWSTSVPMKTAV